MEKEPLPENIERQETKKFGADVVIQNYWVRHAQKMSGEIANAEKTSLSSSAISQSGQGASAEYGQAITGSEHGTKGYVSNSDRTGQTLEKILEGYQQTNPDKPIRSTRVREELTINTPEEFLVLYDQKFSQGKTKILAEMNLSETAFATLSPDEQEKIAEAAEEPVIREWLDDPDSQLAKAFPPQQAAAGFARLFNRRHERLANKLYSGSKIDLFHITHKTITEPFLTSGALVRKSDGQQITKLEQLGGSLETLGNWQSEIKTDSQGNAQITVKIRGEEYEVDKDVLESLLHLQIGKEDKK